MFIHLLNIAVSKVFNLKKIPIEEHVKFFSTGFMFFFIALTYAIGRRLKDSIISTKLAVELISFIKPVIVLPVIFFVSFSLIYLIGNSKDEKLFTDKLVYYVSIPFIVYYAFYGIIDFIGGDELFQLISPNVDLVSFFHCQNIKFLKFYLYEFSLIINKIYHIIFYTITEVYGALVLSYCFWTFVNTYTSIKKASLLYPQYVIFSSFSTAFSGLIGTLLPYLLSICFGSNPQIYNKFSTLINIVICISCMIASIYCYSISLSKHKAEEELIEENTFFRKKKKNKVSFLQSIIALVNNKIILCLFVCVVSYMTCINLVEVTWKKTALNYCKNSENSRMWFDVILGCTHLGIGISTIFMSKLCTYVIVRFGWFVAAMINPIFLGVTGILFFVIIYFDHSFVIGTCVISSLLIAVLVGMMQNIAAKTCKYSFFDSTKEIGLLYLPKEKRDQGKSAIDMLGGRFGKSLGSIIQQVLLACFVSYDQLYVGQEIIKKYIGFILFIIVIIWSIAVFVIGLQIQEIEKNIKNNDKDNSCETNIDKVYSDSKKV